MNAAVIVTRIVTIVTGPGLTTVGGLVMEFPGTLSKYASHTSGNDCGLCGLYHWSMHWPYLVSLRVTNNQRSTARSWVYTRDIPYHTVADCI